MERSRSRAQRLRGWSPREAPVIARVGRAAKRVGRVCVQRVERFGPATGLWRARDALAARIRGAMRAPDVLSVRAALEATGVSWAIAGGWGVDALLGRETRPHDDLDVVLHDYRRDERVVRDALGRLGYALVYEGPSGGSLPERTSLDDGSGHRIEVLAIDRDGVERACAESGSGGSDLFVTGTISGRSVPCVSREAQLALRTGYELRRTDYADIARLGQRSAESMTTLLIPVPAAERARLRRGRSSLPPHITVLYPFLPLGRITAAERARLAATLESTLAFDFTLGRIGWFDDRVVYVEPDPPGPFVEMVSRLVDAYPGHPPYGGAFTEVVPHLTIAEGAAAVRMRWAARRMARRLPIRARASEVWLMAEDGAGFWRPTEVFSLGGPLGRRIR